MLKIWKRLPEDIIEYVFSFAPNFRDKLKACQEEFLDKHRPCYFKKVVAGFSPGIADSPTWHNFAKNDTIRIWNNRPSGPMEYTVLKLHAIEITPHRPPNDRHCMIEIWYYIMDGVSQQINIFGIWCCLGIDTMSNLYRVIIKLI